MRTSLWIMAALAAMLAAGPAAAEPPAKLPTKLFVNDAPAKPGTVADAAAAKAGAAVTLRGTVVADGFAPSSARFVIAGEKETDRATVRVVDKAGKPLEAEIKGRRGLYAGAEVVVTGTRAAGDGVTVDATAICVTKAALPETLIASPTAAAPADVKWVEQARASAKAGQPIAVRGYIGGSLEPFVAERAVFTIMGNGLVSCADKGEDHCKTPWDYCCETKKDIAAHSATIQVVDPTGQLIRAGVKSGDVKELAEVIVVGTVVAADSKTLLINATTIQVAKK